MAHLQEEEHLLLLEELRLEEEALVVHLQLVEEVLPLLEEHQQVEVARLPQEVHLQQEEEAQLLLEELQLEEEAPLLPAEEDLPQLDEEDPPQQVGEDLHRQQEEAQPPEELPLREGDHSSIHSSLLMLPITGPSSFDK